MSGRIIVLPGELVEKIAAGEVIERPASIVKELLENSLDAGATDVRIEIERGGRGFIRIIDNGEGMEGSDLPLAFARFATSKIYRFEDIYEVRSFGFRGEALPSIASICRVEMLSRRHEDASGARIIVEGGQIRDVVDAGCPPGTSVFVSRIFDFVPVRKKFLKSETAEQGACLDVITRIALSHPEVRIRVAANSKDIFGVPATVGISERIALILGDVVDHKHPLSMAREGVEFFGFGSRPEFSRSSGRHIYCYVNRRFVKDHLLHHAVMTAYRNVIGTRRYPAAVIFMSLPADDVDVNVHPTKMEVRFRNPREVYDIIVSALSAYLSRVTPGVQAAGTSGPASGRGHDIREYENRREEAVKRYSLSSGREKLLFSELAPDLRAREREWPETETATGAAAEVVPLSDLSYMGQIALTYLAFSSSSELILLDQHAAHERVLFEDLRRATAGGEGVASQRLLIPEVVSLPPGDLSILAESLSALMDVGLEVESFGGDAVAIKSVPAVLSRLDPKAMLLDALHELGGGELAENKERMHAFLACRGAVKAGQHLTDAEVAALCRSLDATPFSSTCPHGRPVRVSIAVAEMEKMFKRR